jgi:hypothetical protein
MSDPHKKAKRVLSVGQCFADHSGITRVLRGSFGAEVVGADSQREALDLLREESFALALVNRVFDGDCSSRTSASRSRRRGRSRRNCGGKVGTIIWSWRWRRGWASRR